MLSRDRLIFWQILLIFIVAAVNCDNLLVQTNSGHVRGVTLRTLLNNEEFQAYRGIPYAEPPVGNLRYKAPVPKRSWHGVFDASDYSNSCLVVYQSQFFPLNNTQNEDCLYLNVFTPVTQSNKANANKSVMFFIHGGAFTEGDGTNGFYGPDFLVGNDVVLVTFNYRLGPWGFANFGLDGYTGNMGFKDQQLALEWVKRNIKYFGGNPDMITVFGESAGGASVHFHMLSEKSRKLMKRAILMSGSAFAPFARYEPNDHVQLFKKIYGLNDQASAEEVLQFMLLNSSTPIILQETPAVYVERSIIKLNFAAVIEDVSKAENPFITQGPTKIYNTSNINVDSMFGVTSAEFIVLFNPADPYSWLEPLKNYSNIGLPFSGLTLDPNSSEYLKVAKRIYRYYFGTRKLEATIENLNTYLEMSTDINFVYPAYRSLQLQAQLSETYCYQNNLTLGLNAVKIKENIEYLDGMSHFEDLFYIFRANKYENLYDNALANLTDPFNRQTLNSVNFDTKLFTDYAKFGRPAEFGRFAQPNDCCIGIENDGLKSLFGLRRKSMQFWDSIYDSVKSHIVDQF